MTDVVLLKAGRDRMRAENKRRHWTVREEWEDGFP